jgi:hypothetical protein
MSIQNITPNSANSSLGLPDRVWASGMFNYGDFENSLRITDANNVDYAKFSSEIASRLSYRFESDPIAPIIEATIATTSSIPTDISQLQNGAEYVGSDNITQVLRISQVDYDALPTKDINTLYIVVN